MSLVADVITKYQSELVEEWITEQTAMLRGKAARYGDRELRRQCEEFIRRLEAALQAGGDFDPKAPQWEGVRELLVDISASRVAQGFTPTETATFVFSFKRPLFVRLRGVAADAQSLAAATWEATEILDRIGLYTFEVYQKSREEVISRQQQEMLELSTPVVQLWEGILALPLIGTLDSARTQVVMQNLLEAVVATGSEIAIIDITGVPTVDTLVAQHLLKTVSAARLMGADCIISGIRPQIAQTIVHLGVDLGNIITKATLADAFVLALRRSGMNIDRKGTPETAE